MLLSTSSTLNSVINHNDDNNSYLYSSTTSPLSLYSSDDNSDLEKDAIDKG
jgi:hypothetical protein